MPSREPSAEHDAAQEQSADASTPDARSPEPIEASAESNDIRADGANDEIEGGAPDVTPEAGECTDGRGPVEEPDADDESLCSADRPCENPLICLGVNCEEPWYCVPHFAPHPCPVDAVPHCGCDGVTFHAPNSCVDRPYVHIGACDDGTNCDATDLRCSQQEPTCAAGTLPSVVRGMYGPCVPFSSCRCEFLWECPHRERYACDRSTWRCAQLPAD